MAHLVGVAALARRASRLMLGMPRAYGAPAATAGARRGAAAADSAPLHNIPGVAGAPRGFSAGATQPPRLPPSTEQPGVAGAVQARRAAGRKAHHFLFTSFKLEPLAHAAPHTRYCRCRARQTEVLKSVKEVGAAKRHYFWHGYVVGALVHDSLGRLKAESPTKVGAAARPTVRSG
jgi:hypothetical protein